MILRQFSISTFGGRQPYSISVQAPVPRIYALRPMNNGGRAQGKPSHRFWRSVINTVSRQMATRNPNSLGEAGFNSFKVLSTCKEAGMN